MNAGVQIAKGGKYILGWFIISTNYQVTLPGEALTEYSVNVGDTVVLSTGSASSGGFIVMSQN
ncbi:MAG: hypothetical protein LBD32_01965 [Cytophagales bacterium]|jgi:hypothetical protein|nr:hypothetical protein [Cytophagales bacterium]